MQDIVQANNRYFPYTGAAGWLTTLRDLFRRSTPARVDADWLTTSDRFSFSIPNARQFISMMQKLGWIESDGSLTTTGKQLRLVGQPYQEAMEAIVSAHYSDLLDQMQTPGFSSKDVDQFFVAASSMGQSGRQQMISVLRWFMREAGMTELEDRIWKPASGRVRGETAKVVRMPKKVGSDDKKPVRGSRITAAARTSEDPGVSTLAGARLATISSVLRITIDGSWEQDRIDALFKSLSQLLNGEE